MILVLRNCPQKFHPNISTNIRITVVSIIVYILELFREQMNCREIIRLMILCGLCHLYEFCSEHGAVSSYESFQSLKPIF